MKIFVSYTTRDNFIDSRLLSLVSDFLEEYGRPFIDLIHNDSIDRQKRVKKELYSSDLFILLNSHSVNFSQWVDWELTCAYELKKPILQFNLSKKMNDKDLFSEMEEKINEYQSHHASEALECVQSIIDVNV